MLETCQINPAHEYILEYSLDEVIKKIETNFLGHNTKTSLEETKSSAKPNSAEDVELIRAGDYLSKIDKYYNSFYSNKE